MVDRMENAHYSETRSYSDSLIDRIDALEAWGTAPVAVHEALERCRADIEFAARWAPLPDDFPPADLSRIARRKRSLMRGVWAVSPPRRAYLARCLLAVADRTISRAEAAS